MQSYCHSGLAPVRYRGSRATFNTRQEDEMKEIAGVRLPDTHLCQAAMQFAQRVSDPHLYHHVMRSCVYADWIGQRRRWSYDRETLFVATVLHDLGLTAVAPVRERFELEGADAAKAFLAEQGADERMLDRVWDAIALHTTAGIPLRKAPEVALSHLGIACDLRGLPGDPDVEEVTALVLEEYPWLGLDRALLDTLVGLYRRNPAAAASHAVADACEGRVEGFRRFNLCDVLAERAKVASQASTQR
jgi:hypothetical protein